MTLASRRVSQVGQILRDMRMDLDRLRFPLRIASAEDGSEALGDIIHQLDDYMLPRYAAIDAPLLAVFGGSTGAGKSSLINAVVREHIAKASAIRPTTRRPLLLHHPDDASWFSDQRILPGLARVTGRSSVDEKLSSDSTGMPITELGLHASAHVPNGIALLDSPDIDSVVVENRQLAAQLLAAADLWVFVTTAARYADAIPWAMLDDAAQRNIVIAVVLNRVPPGVGAEVRADLAARLERRGLASAPLFVISEQELVDDGFIAEPDVAPLRGWLESISADAASRAAVIRQTLAGAVRNLDYGLFTVAQAYDDQLARLGALRWDLDQAYRHAVSEVNRQVADGTLLRGEVLARWQDFVGTGEWARKLESGISRLRDRITQVFTAKTPSTGEVEGAIEDGVHALLVGEAEAAIGAVIDAWARAEAFDTDIVRGLLRDSQMRNEQATAAVRGWQQRLLEMIREESAGKRSTARMLALGVNAVGVALMIVVFASTGGLVGGELAVAGGTAVVAQRVLEAVFGDDAVRRMARRAREDLNRTAEEFFAADSQVFADYLAGFDINSEYLGRLQARTEQLREELKQEGAL
ncbi:MAG: hypothetical protein GX483_07260 [Actinomycetaceae bacterium]|nr:hypothetical protein [Actinomycetaceae bacterium]